MKIIALEGLDGSGKSTQIRLLQKFLHGKGFKAIVFKFPFYESPTGRLIKDYLEGKLDVSAETFDLLQTADKQTLQYQFNSWEEQGIDFLILDRYTLTQMVYGEANGVDLAWIKKLQEKLRKPDFEVYIDIPVSLSMERSGKTDRYEKDAEMLTRVRENYWKKILNKEGFFIDGTCTVDVVHAEIINRLKTVLPEIC